MKTIRLILALFIGIQFVGPVWGQSFLSYDIKLFYSGRHAEDKVPMDRSRLSVTYTYSFVADTVEKRKCHDRYVLEIGHQVSRFYSLYADMCDSITYRYWQAPERSGRNPHADAGVNSTNWLKPEEQPQSKDFYMNFPQQGELSVYTNFQGRMYLYKEPVPVFNWNISPETREILGYNCLKATTSFRGRDYEAWFTPSVPMASGPWKFSGLPGLILSVYDTEGLFSFEAIELEQSSPKTIYRYEGKNTSILPISRENMAKLERRAWEDPVGLTFESSPSTKTYATIDPRTGEIKELKPGEFQYNPVPALELE